MNFTPNNAYQLPGSDSAMRDYYWNSDNYWGRQGIRTGTGASPQQTPYLWDPTKLERPQIVVDPATGNTYYHMIFGSLADGFIQESYVQMGFGGYGNPCEPANSSSASGGTGTYISRSPGACNSNPASLWLGNGYDPLDMDANATALNIESGNGTANPTRVTVRQIVNDGEIMMEFHKDRYAYKPRISQMVAAPDISIRFDLDMRHIRYDDAATTATLVNTMALWGDNLPVDAGEFDMSTDVQNSDINGGKFIYTEGVGFGGSEGTYDYMGGSFDVQGVDWKQYYDYREANPWAFEDAKL